MDFKMTEPPNKPIDPNDSPSRSHALRNAGLSILLLPMSFIGCTCSSVEQQGQVPDRTQTAKYTPRKESRLTLVTVELPGTDSGIRGLDLTKVAGPDRRRFLGEGI